MQATASLPQTLTPYHAKYYAYELTRRCPPDSDDRLASALVDAQVDLNPHQIDAALFSFKSPLSRGVLLADEVGLGKTIEAGWCWRSGGTSQRATPPECARAACCPSERTRRRRTGSRGHSEARRVGSVGKRVRRSAQAGGDERVLVPRAMARGVDSAWIIG